MLNLKFNEWIQENKSPINIDTKIYQTALAQEAEVLKDLIRERNLKAKKFNVDQFKDKIQKVFINYPHLRALMLSINSRDARKIMAQSNNLREWIASQPNRMELRPYMSELWILVDSLDIHNESASMLEIDQILENSIKETMVKMEEVKNLINQTISKIEEWNNSSITIVPTIPENEHGVELKSTKNSYLYVGDPKKHTFFTLYFDDDKIEIDEVADAGDEDVFDNPKIESDYFSLINKLRNPFAKDKILTLYTARPRKDRNYYLASKVLPINLFLTNSFNHAEGISLDFAEDGEQRDVWKVKINSKYLTQTLEGPIKYYQVTKNNSPTISMNLA